MATAPYEFAHPHLANRTEFERTEHEEDKAPHLETFAEYEDHLTREPREHTDPSKYHWSGAGSVASAT
jgi:hypothetical protein